MNRALGPLKTQPSSDLTITGEKRTALKKNRKCCGGDVILFVVGGDRGVEKNYFIRTRKIPMKSPHGQYSSL